MDFSKKYDISVYLTEEQLNKRIAEIGAQITEKYRGQSVYLICILKGSIFFTTELAKRIDLPMTMDFMSVSSYGSGTESSGDVKIKKDLEHSIEGENVIIIEDIIDSGNTLSRLSKLLAKRNPKSLTICTLLDKPERRVVDDVNVDPKAMGHIEAIIQSMTKEERNNPSILNGPRKKRIAMGSGRNIAEVNRLLKQFEEMKKMMKQMNALTKGKKGKFKFPFR